MDVLGVPQQQEISPGPRDFASEIFIKGPRLNQAGRHQNTLDSIHSRPPTIQLTLDSPY